MMGGMRQHFLLGAFGPLHMWGRAESPEMQAA